MNASLVQGPPVAAWGPPRAGVRAGLRAGLRAGVRAGLRTGVRAGLRAGVRTGLRAGVAAVLALALAAPALSGPGTPAARADDTQEPPAASLFEIYAANRRDGIPNYVTADLMLVTYSLIRRARLLDQELAMAGRLANLAQGLDAAAAAEPEDAAGQANRDLTAILVALTQGRARIERAGDPARAQAELALILASAGIQDSPLWGWPLDYSQFRPRGPYAATPELAAYFRALRYASLALFPMLASEATGVSAAEADRALVQARRLAEHLQAGAAPRADHDAIDRLYRWQFGAGEDLRIEDLLAAPADTPAAMRQWLFDRARDTGRQPRILAGTVDAARLESGRTAADALTGFRLLPARYSADTAAIQRLVYDQVGVYRGAPGLTPFGLGIVDGQPVKAYPEADELLALLGSPSAAARIAASGQTAFAGYAAASTEAARRLDDAEGLLASHLALMRAALAGTEDADAAVRDTRMKAFWTWQRYLAVLHGKPSYTLGGKGFVQPRPRQQAGLEPTAALYRALAETVAAHRRHEPDPAWDEFAALLEEVIRLAERVGAAQDLDAAAADFLNALDQTLANLLAKLGSDADRPIVVDIHTVPSLGQIVVEGTGWARPVSHVLADGTRLRGARLSHHERKWPLAPRPTDADWRAWLETQPVETDAAAASLSRARAPIMPASAAPGADTPREDRP